MSKRLMLAIDRYAETALNVVRAGERRQRLLKHPMCFEKAVSPRRPFPSFGVQPLLLAGQSTPCGLHPHQGNPGLLVFGSFS